MNLKILISIFIITWIVLIGRVYYITVESNSHYAKLAERNTIKKEPIIPVRGIIYDRNGKPLAVNKLGFKVTIKPHLIRKKSTALDETLNFLVKELKNVDKEELRTTYEKLESPYRHGYLEIIPFVPYDEFISHYTKLSLNENLKITPTTLRYYPEGKIASHILGYVSKADKWNRDIDPDTRVIGAIGKGGIEKYYNKELQGKLGVREYQVSAFNEEIKEISRVEASQNQDITLNLDIRIQKLIHEIFQDKLSGVVVVMDARDGGIIAAGSFPEYDINKFVTGISSKEWKQMVEDFNHPFLNKMVNSIYPPGSVIKPTIALAFLENPAIDPTTKFHCEGSFEFGGRSFRCWSTRGHGYVNLRKSIRESCDIYYYKGSYRVGIEAISKKLKDFGLGVKTGIDLPNEFVGVVPNKEWKMERYGRPWFIGETFITSIGQGSFLASPVQIARNTAALATGRMPYLKLAKDISGKEVETVYEDPMSPSDKKYISLIRKSMLDVVNTPYGTASKYIDTPILVAGKTGTAQVVGIPQGEKVRMKEGELEYYKRSHAWLTTYAPADNPRYVITVLVEHGGHGGHAAGPIVSAVYNKMYELGYFKEDYSP